MLRLSNLSLRFLESASSQKNHKPFHLRSAQQASRCKPNTRPLPCTRVYRLLSPAHRNTLAAARRFLPFHKPTTGRLRIREATLNRLRRVPHFLIQQLRLYSNQEYALQVLLLTAHIPPSLNRVRAHVYPPPQPFQRLKWPGHPHTVPIRRLFERPFSKISCRLPRELVPPEDSTPTHNTPMRKPSSKFKETSCR